MTARYSSSDAAMDTIVDSVGALDAAAGNQRELETAADARCGNAPSVSAAAKAAIMKVLLLFMGNPSFGDRRLRPRLRWLSKR
jgi:hypothetical protein